MKRRKKIWVQHVAVDAAVLRSRLRVLTASPSGLTPEQHASVQGINEFIDRATAAADRQDPVPSRIFNWFAGVLVETAYRNLHAARAQIVDLYTWEEIDAEMPSAVARAHMTLNRGDPRCISLEALRGLPKDKRRVWLRRLIEDGYEGVDTKHAQLRGFRNITLYAAVVTILLVAMTVFVVSLHPSVMPLCFPDPTATETPPILKNCPTRTKVFLPTGGDIWVVALVGLLGGALAATVAIRKLQGSSTPYDVPVALAWLKVPLGAFTAILGLVAIQGGFIPGLSALDSQEQILAWALLLGFAQQLFTGLLDKRAQDLLSGIPSKDAMVPHQGPGAAPPTSGDADEPSSPTPPVTESPASGTSTPRPDTRNADTPNADTPSFDTPSADTPGMPTANAAIPAGEAAASPAPAHHG